MKFIKAYGISLIFYILLLFILTLLMYFDFLSNLSLIKTLNLLCLILATALFTRLSLGDFKKGGLILGICFSLGFYTSLWLVKFLTIENSEINFINLGIVILFGAISGIISVNLR